MVDLNFLVRTAAASLFVIALGALLVWAFRTFFGGQSTSGFMRPRAKRLGVVETATVDAKRRLLLVPGRGQASRSWSAARSIC